MPTVIDLFKIMDDTTKIVIRNQYNEILYHDEMEVVFQQLTIGELLTEVEDLDYSITYNCIAMKGTF